MNSQLLKGLIVAHDGNQQSLADAMGMSLSRLNAKINEWEGAEFSRSEMIFLKNRYHMDDEMFNKIFL